ncbi:MAG: hypothetical protein ACYTF9_12760, partial [Planctomycetota bacterium]
MTIRHALLTLVLLTLGAAAQGQETAYDIVMTRPFEIGQRFHYRGEGMFMQKTGGVVLGQEDTTPPRKYVMRMESRMTVGAVDDKGRALGAVHVIESCVMTQDGRAVRTFRPGSVLKVTRDEFETEYEIDGAMAAGEEKMMFELLASLDANGATEDEMYGTAQPRLVGETWPISSERMAADFQKQTAQSISVEQIAGETRFVEVTEHDGQRCARLHTEFTTTDFIPGLEALPADAELLAAGMAAQFEGLYPVDLTKQWLARSGQVV